MSLKFSCRCHLTCGFVVINIDISSEQVAKFLNALNLRSSMGKNVTYPWMLRNLLSEFTHPVSKILINFLNACSLPVEESDLMIVKQHKKKTFVFFPSNLYIIFVSAACNSLERIIVSDLRGFVGCNHLMLC